uniref:Uncharacterized protein n=1 Tax=Graphocephala atropunctata TaxID=36148 RepID=A0A1B6LP97_9HEMI
MWCLAAVLLCSLYLSANGVLGSGDGKSTATEKDVAEGSKKSESDYSYLNNCPRVTTSEEIKIEEDGTFHSKNIPDTTLEHCESQTIESSEIRSISMSDSADSSGSKPKGEKGDKGQEKWPENMDPKEKRKKKASSEARIKKKELVKKEIYGLHQARQKTKNSVRRNEQLRGAFPAKNLNHNLPNTLSQTSVRVNNLHHNEDPKLNKERVNLRSPYAHLETHKTIDLKTGKINKINQKLKGQMLEKDAALKNTHGNRKDSSIFDHFMGACKLRHNHKHHHQRNPRARRRPIQGDQRPRPFL